MAAANTLYETWYLMSAVECDLIFFVSYLDGGMNKFGVRVVQVVGGRWLFGCIGWSRDG
jgi:hypothetical protein